MTRRRAAGKSGDRQVPPSSRRGLRLGDTKPDRGLAATRARSWPQWRSSEHGAEQARAAGQRVLTWRGAVVQCVDAPPRLSISIEHAALDHPGGHLRLRRRLTTHNSACAPCSSSRHWSPWQFGHGNPYFTCSFSESASPFIYSCFWGQRLPWLGSWPGRKIVVRSIGQSSGVRPLPRL